jgi:carboxypeptidase Taq
MVGRSPEFWKHYYASLKDNFEELKQVKREDFVKAVNVVKPSLIRVEADEVTYGLHIILRFEIERELVAGRIKPEQLPEMWNKKMEELLGIIPANDREGVLQDVHWAHGSFGYFPTYLLGTMTAAQFFRTAKKEFEVNKAIEQGNLLVLREWLRKKIHQYGKLHTAKELIVKVTGETLSPEYFLEYLEDKFSKVY